MVDIEGDAFDESRFSWVQSYGGHANIDNPTSLYFVALYWACMTISTVGYGDVVRHGVMRTCHYMIALTGPVLYALILQPAQSDGERIVACLCMITGAFIFAYVVGSVCNIATSLSAEVNE